MAGLSDPKCTAELPRSNPCETPAKATVAKSSRAVCLVLPVAFADMRSFFAIFDTLLPASLCACLLCCDCKYCESGPVPSRQRSVQSKGFLNQLTRHWLCSSLPGFYSVVLLLEISDDILQPRIQQERRIYNGCQHVTLTAKASGFTPFSISETQ